MKKYTLMDYARDVITVMGSQVSQTRKAYSDCWNAEAKRIRKTYGDLFLAPFGIDTDFLDRFTKE